MEAVVNITGLAFGGSGVGRIGGKVVFVPYTAPGDEARIRITSEKKAFSEGELIELLKASDLRQEPSCEYFGECGGCGLQHIRYPRQVEWKEKILVETLKRIGKVALPPLDPPVPSPKEFSYRTRARFHMDGWKLGFYEHGSHRVVDIEACPLLEPALNEALSGIRKAFREAGAGPSPFSSLEIGLSGKDNKAVALFAVSPGLKPSSDLAPALNKVTALKGYEILRPKEKVERNLLLYDAGGLNFKANIRVFSQINLYQNENLIKKVIEYAGLTGKERVLDLFSGVGNLSLPMAASSKEITGVESNGEAVMLARENASLNSITSARFMRGEAHKWLRENIKTLEKERPHVVVLDPPRGGDPETVRVLSVLKPEKIVYVSCSPPTLARDISLLTGSGYRLFRAGLFDMFPQTYHIESIAGLELKT